MAHAALPTAPSLVVLFVSSLMSVFLIGLILYLPGAAAASAALGAS